MPPNVILIRKYFSRTFVFCVGGQLQKFHGWVTVNVDESQEFFENVPFAFYRME